MSDVELDITEWKKYNKDLLYLIEETLPRECKKFMRREGGRLATASRRKARETVRKKTGNYFKSIKSSRAWKNSRGGYGVKAYSSAPHAHLLESGHEIYIRGYPTGRKSRAFNIMKQANEGFQNKFWKDCEDFVAKVMEEGVKG